MNSCTKRLMQELNELLTDPSPEFKAEPLESDILEWHFSIRGPPNSCYEGGRYHGRLLFPKDYPFKPPNIVFLTPNGRFQVGKKICLSITGYHPESWRPAWGVRTALTAIISFMLTPGEGSVGAVEWSDEARRIGAKESMDWSCAVCGVHNRTVLPLESEVPSVVLKGEDELVLTAPKEAEKDSSQADAVGRKEESKLDVGSGDVEGTNVSTKGATNETTSNSTSIATANIPPTAIAPSVVPPPQTAPKPHVTPARATQNDLVWKLDSLILMIVAIIIAWVAVRIL